MQQQRILRQVIFSIILTLGCWEPFVFIQVNTAQSMPDRTVCKSKLSGLYLSLKQQPQNKTIREEHRTWQKKCRHLLSTNSSGRKAPAARYGAATRGLCEAKPSTPPKNITGEKLIALLPEKEVSLTVVASPSITFYIPATCAKTMQFELLDKSTKKTYETFLETPPSSGLLTLKFSALKDIPTLEIDKEYHWSLSIIIDPRDPSSNMSVAGVLQRVAPDPFLERELKGAGLGDRPWLYAVNGLWLDTVEATIKDSVSNPEAWKSLLASVELDALVDKPFIKSFVLKTVQKSYTEENK